MPIVEVLVNRLVFLLVNLLVRVLNGGLIRVEVQIVGEAAVGNAPHRIPNHQVLLVVNLPGVHDFRIPHVFLHMIIQIGLGVAIYESGVLANRVE